MKLVNSKYVFGRCIPFKSETDKKYFELGSSTSKARHDDNRLKVQLIFIIRCLQDETCQLEICLVGVSLLRVKLTKSTSSWSVPLPKQSLAIKAGKVQLIFIILVVNFRTVWFILTLQRAED